MIFLETEAAVTLLRFRAPKLNHLDNVLISKERFR